MSVLAFVPKYKYAQTYIFFVFGPGQGHALHDFATHAGHTVG